MSEIYQPAIILHLLQTEGSATKQELARVLSGYDESVQEYYQRILMRWPKQTLTKHGIVEYDRKRKEFVLNFKLTPQALLEKAKSVCESRIEEWIVRHPSSTGQSSVGASIRYRVLKAARGKCELCGISAKVSPIDIDHIVPASSSSTNI